MALVNVLLIRYQGGYVEARPRLINTVTGRPAFTGPNGEYGSAISTGVYTTLYVMPDGVSAYYQVGGSIDPGNLAALLNYTITVFGRCEAFLKLGGITTASDAQAIAQSIFALEDEPMISVTAGIEPVGTADTPYEGFNVGDTITAPDPTGAATSQRVTAITVAEDQDGNVLFTPQLESLIFESDQRLQNWLKSLADGTVAGTANVAQATPSAPTTPVSRTAQAPAEHIWSMGAGLLVVAWGPYDVPVALDLAFINLRLDASPTTTAVTVRVRLNGSPLAASVVTVGVGASPAQARVNFVQACVPGDVLEMEMTSADGTPQSAVITLGFT